MQIITDQDLIGFIGRQESQFIGKPSDWREETDARLNGEISQAGLLFPWSKTHTHIRLRPKEVSIWGGFNGHGKSQLLGMISAWGIKQSPWLIASLEMPPPATIARMLRQTSGSRYPGDRFKDQFYQFTDEKLYIYDQTDSVKSDRILGLINYAAQELGVKHIVIDSLIKCGIGRENFEAQAAFVDRLCWSAKANDIHIHLVHHMRKHGDDDTKIPSKLDFRGAGEITDLVDNVFIVFRNKKKEEKIRTGQHVDIDEPDCILKCDKQRHGEWEGSFKLWFEPESMQYVAKQGRRITYANSFS